MKTIKKLSQVIKLSKEAEAEGKTMYIRWSRGPMLDKKQGTSLDYTNHSRHNGLSAQTVRHNDPKLLAQMLPEYSFLRRKDQKIYCWIFTGQQNGVDSDNAPTIEADSIEPVAKIGEALIEQCSAYSCAYRAHRQHYAYNPQKPETYTRNAQLQSDLDEKWAALQ